MGSLSSTGANESSTISLPLLHFNDVYRVSQKYEDPTPLEGGGGGGEGASSAAPPPLPKGDHPHHQQYISAAQFAATLATLRDGWEDRNEGGKEGLVLFSGDVFSPSVESTITRGSHMVPLLNTFNLDCSVAGNHDFDHSYAHLTTLIKDCNFPWLLSNIYDANTSKVPEPLLEYLILPRKGLKIGIIGLVEADWIATIPSFPPHFKHQSMPKTALRLSKLLREEKGCDLIVALTHSRINNDLKLAEEVGAVAGLGADAGHGVDLILGGHDHIYYVGRGVKSWEGWDRPESIPGTEGDKNTLVIKSGTDFRELSEFTLTLTQNPSNSIRKYVISSIQGHRHAITPSTPTSQPVQDLIDSLLGKVSETLSKPACYTLTEWDCRSEIVRTGESAVGDWLADVLMCSYAESLESKGAGRADIAFNCGGTLRGDSVYPAERLVTLGDILEILPFEDPVVVIEMHGEAIWDCLESSLSKYPSQEGRFPVIAGMEVVWDSRLPPGQRVKSVHLVSHRKRVSDRLGRPADETDDSSGTEDDEEADEGGMVVQVESKVSGEAVCKLKKVKYAVREEIKREKGGRVYKVVTREYMAQGYDGFDAMKGSKYLIDDEVGQLMSAIVRTFLLGSSFLLRKQQLFSPPTSPVKSTSSPPTTPSRPAFFSSRTSKILTRSQKVQEAPRGATVVKHGWRSIRDALKVARFEHMSEVDECEGAELRQHTAFSASQLLASPPILSPPLDGQTSAFIFPIPTSPKKEVAADAGSTFSKLDSNVAIVAPVKDGRLRDLARDE